MASVPQSLVKVSPVALSNFAVWVNVSMLVKGALQVKSVRMVDGCLTTVLE